jgi:hypothetical protein
MPRHAKAAVRFRSGLRWIPLCSWFRPYATDFFNSLLKLNNTAAKLGEKLSAAQVNLVGAGKLEVVGPARR